MTKIWTCDCATISVRSTTSQPCSIQGWKGLKNGNLLAAASGTFEVLITADNHLPEQQNLTKFNIAVLVVRAESKLLDDLLPLMPEILRAIPTLRPGTAGRVGVPPHTQPRRLG